MSSFISRPEGEDVLPGEARKKFSRMRELIREEKLLISGKNENGIVVGGELENYTRLAGAQKRAQLVDVKTHDEGRQPASVSVSSDYGEKEEYLEDEDERAELENIKQQKLEVALAAYEAVEGELMSLTRGITELEHLLAEEDIDDDDKSYGYSSLPFPHHTKLSNGGDQAVHTPLVLHMNCKSTAVEEVE